MMTDTCHLEMLHTLQPWLLQVKLPGSEANQPV